MTGVTLPGVAMVCARTTRSQAYLQRLLHEGLRPEAVIVYGTPGDRIVSPVALQRPAAPPWRPDLSVPLETTADDLGAQVVLVDDRAITGAELERAVRAVGPALAVFSGYPGQLVPPSLLGVAPHLHVHAGELPAFRGSTTLYYAALEGRDPVATAILLDEEIDTGQVVGSATAPLRRDEIDPDHSFDNALRAEALVSVLRHRAEHGCLPEPRPQPDGGRLHYVIHPVLKHLALLGSR